MLRGEYPFSRVVFRMLLGGSLALVFVMTVESIAKGWGFAFESVHWRYLAFGCAAITASGSGRLWPAPSAQRFFVLSCRILAFLALTLVLMQPVKTRSIASKRKLLVLVDESPSVAMDLKQADSDSWTSRLARLSEGLGRGDELSIVPFSGVGDAEGKAAIRKPDLSPILEMIPSMVSLDADTTVLLLTDGGHAGEALDEPLARLRNAGLRVLQGRLPSKLDRGDIAVREILLPSQIAAGSRVDISVEVDVAANMSAQCEMQLDGVQIGQSNVESGTARFERVKVGNKTQEILVECLRDDGLGDAVPGNNRMRSYLAPEKRQRVLVVDRNPEKAQVLSQALGPSFAVEVRGPGGVPRTLDEWRSFDTVLISDLPRVWNQRRNQFNSAQMAQAEQFVQEGGGLIMVGGPEALGPGGYTGTPLEQTTLPVWLDTPRVQEKPQLALVLVLDRSGSMSGVKLNLAKEAAAATVETLGRDDRIGVVVFDAKPETVVGLQRASNRFRILDDIGHVGAGGGTSIRPAIAEAFRMLRKNDARFRHVILLTDGQSPRDSILETVQSMAESGITVSTVAVGQQADRALLRNMAEAGSGRYHFTDSPRNIPRIFLSETREVRQQTADVERFRPQLTRLGKRQTFLRKYAGEMGSLEGMVLVRAKPSGEVLLKGAKGNPLLVRGNRGKGSVYVFTSDIKGIWTASWLRSLTYPQFWRGLVRATLPRFDTGPEVSLRDQGTSISIEVKYPIKDLEAAAPDIRVQTPGSARGSGQLYVQLRPDAPGTFRGIIESAEPGAFLVEIRAEPSNPRAPVVKRVLTRPYEQELNPAILASGRQHLDALHERGLLENVNPEKPWSKGASTKMLREDFWRESLILFIVLWLLGVTARRIPFGRSEPIGWL